MANRPYFFVSEEPSKIFEEQCVDFEYFSGFAVSQKQKSIDSLHDAIRKNNSRAQVLEVSTKSRDRLGMLLSAFNLKFRMPDGQFYPLENVFQSSKVFKNGGPFKDILEFQPIEAKRDERLKSSGDLIRFELNGEQWPLEPKSMFYDFTYISALRNDKELCEKLMDFDTFTDIEFNPAKSINCQARSVAICVSLLRKGKLDAYLSDRELFKTIYKSTKVGPAIQTDLFGDFL